MFLWSSTPSSLCLCQTQRYMLLRKPKLDVKMSFWVVSCCSSKQFLNETHTVSLTDIFFRRAGPKCHRRQTCGDNAGSEKSRVTSVGAWNEIPWVDDIAFLWKNMQNALQNALQNGAVEAFFWQDSCMISESSQSDLGWSPEIGAVAGRQGHERVWAGWNELETCTGNLYKRICPVKCMVYPPGNQHIPSQRTFVDYFPFPKVGHVIVP